MSTLEIRDLVASVAGKTILNGITLTVSSGEVHAVMGPNGAGKSTLSAVVMGKPGYEVLVRLGAARRRRHAGPPELAARPGRSAPRHAVSDRGARCSAPRCHASRLRGAGMATTDLDARLRAEAARIGFDAALFQRALNVDLSGGEKKRNETLQVAMLEPKIVILDELDSGLDIDALRDCARRIEALTNEQNIGVLAITHYNRLLEVLRPDHVHILVKGRIVSSGGAELADQLEIDGYAAFAGADEEPSGGALADLFG